MGNTFNISGKVGKQISLCYVAAVSSPLHLTNPARQQLMQLLSIIFEILEALPILFTNDSERHWVHEMAQKLHSLQVKLWLSNFTFQINIQQLYHETSLMYSIQYKDSFVHLEIMYIVMHMLFEHISAERDSW